MPSVVAVRQTAAAVVPELVLVHAVPRGPASTTSVVRLGLFKAAAVRGSVVFWTSSRTLIMKALFTVQKRIEAHWGALLVRCELSDEAIPRHPLAKESVLEAELVSWFV
ncbi:hypothetical protein PG984_005284 [Apiospora sp. TS-2023a]